MDNEEIRKSLIEARKDCGLNVIEAAKLSWISPSALRGLEKGTRTLYLSVVAQIARAYLDYYELKTDIQHSGMFAVIYALRTRECENNTLRDKIQRLRDKLDKNSVLPKKGLL